MMKATISFALLSLLLALPVAALPFFAMLVVTIGVITVFPQVVTWLPDVVMGAEKR